MAMKIKVTPTLKGFIIFRLPTPSSVKIKVLTVLTCAALSAIDTESEDVSEFTDLALLTLQATSIIVTMLIKIRFFMVMIFKRLGILLVS